MAYTYTVEYETKENKLNNEYDQSILQKLWLYKEEEEEWHDIGYQRGVKILKYENIFYFVNCFFVWTTVWTTDSNNQQKKGRTSFMDVRFLAMDPLKIFKITKISL